jgi:hypothetical protein
VLRLIIYEFGGKLGSCNKFVFVAQEPGNKFVFVAQEPGIL